MGENCGNTKYLHLKSTEQCLASSELLTPHPLSTQRVGPLPVPKGGGGGGTHSPGGEWGGGSIVLWTPDIGLASYIIIPLRVATSLRIS